MQNSFCINPTTYVANRWEYIGPKLYQTVNTHRIYSGSIRVIDINKISITKNKFSWDSNNEIALTGSRASSYSPYYTDSYMWIIVDPSTSELHYYVKNTGGTISETYDSTYGTYKLYINKATELFITSSVSTHNFSSTVEALSSSSSSTYPTTTGNYITLKDSVKVLCKLKYLSSSFSPPTTTYPAYYWEAHPFTPGTEIPATTDSFYEIYKTPFTSYYHFKYYYAYSDSISVEQYGSTRQYNRYYLSDPTYYNGEFSYGTGDIIFGEELTGKFFCITIYGRPNGSSSWTQLVNYSGFGGYSLSYDTTTVSGTSNVRIKHVNKPNFYGAYTTYPGKGEVQTQIQWSMYGYGPVIDLVNYSTVSSFDSSSYSASYISGKGAAKIGKPPYYIFFTTTIAYQQINDDSLFKGVSYENSVNSDTDLTIGNSANAKITFSTNALTGDDIGKWFTWYQKQNDDTDYKSQGVYLITDVEHTDTDKYKVTAYDPLYFFEIDVSTWIQNLTFPITIGDLFEALCGHVGTLFVYDATNTPNIDVSVPINTFGTSDITARKVLEYIAAATSTNAVVDINGRVELKLIPQSDGTIFDNSEFFKYTYADYNVPQIQSLKIATDDEDTGIVVGNGTNIVKIDYNPLLYSESQEDMVDLADTILTYLNNIEVYKPGTLTTYNDKSVNVGDRIQIQINNQYPYEYADFIVFSKSIDSSGVTFTCTGNATRDTATSQATGSFDPSIGKYSRIIPNATGVEIVSGQTGYHLATKEITTKFSADNVSIEDTSYNATGTAIISPTTLTIDNVNIEDIKTDTAYVNDRLGVDYISTTNEQYWNARRIYKQAEVPNTTVTTSKWYVTSIPAGILEWSSDHYAYEVNDLVYVTTGSITKYYICKEYNKPTSGSSFDPTYWVELIAQTWYELVQGTDDNYWAQSADPVGTYANDEKFRASTFEVLYNNAVCGEIFGDTLTVGSTSYTGVKISSVGSTDNSSITLTPGGTEILFGTDENNFKLLLTSSGIFAKKTVNYVETGSQTIIS